MSYLLGLVRKIHTLRPAIAPRLLPGRMSPGLGLEEVVEDIIETSSRPQPLVPLAAAAPPLAARSSSPELRDLAPSDDAARRQDNGGQAASGPRTDAPPAPHQAQLPPQRTVSRRSRVISRRFGEPLGHDDAMPESSEAPLAADLDPRPIIASRTPLPVAARELLPAWREPRPALVALPTQPHERDLARPDVQISIGRLEVRANIAAPVKTERPAPFRPHLTLQDYLAGRPRG